MIIDEVPKTICLQLIKYNNASFQFLQLFKKYDSQ
jgi:hypothetical protein